VGHGNAIHPAFKYDMKEVIPLFMTIFERLNLYILTQMVISNDGIGLPVEEDETNMFGVGASMEKSS
jgi:short subunit fatty acids transporter